MSNSYCIYCHTNKINGKKYIGQTHEYTKRCQPSNYKGCTKLYNAILKYGWNNFSHQILEDNLTLEQVNEREEYYIQLYNTVENGYNIKSGGLNNIYTEESRKKMSQNCSKKKRIICIETNIEYPSAKEIERQLGYSNSNIIACCKGKLHTAYGFHWRYADEECISKKDKRKRPVKCIETEIIYESAAEASRQTGIGRPNISLCCECKMNTAGGYHWKFAEEN